MLGGILAPTLGRTEIAGGGAAGARTRYTQPTAIKDPLDTKGFLVPGTRTWNHSHIRIGNLSCNYKLLSLGC